MDKLAHHKIPAFNSNAAALRAGEKILAACQPNESMRAFVRRIILFTMMISLQIVAVDAHAFDRLDKVQPASVLSEVHADQGTGSHVPAVADADHFLRFIEPITGNVSAASERSIPMSPASATSERPQRRFYTIMRPPIDPV